MKNYTQTDSWVMMGAVMATVSVSAFSAPDYAVKTRTEPFINNRPVCFQNISAKITPACEHSEYVRRSPRRKAAMDKAGAKIAARLAQEMGGQTIAALRIAKGYTQSELARAAGLQQSYLSRIENHRQSLQDKTVNSLAAVLGTSPAAVREAFNKQWDYLQQKGES